MLVDGDSENTPVSDCSSNSNDSGKILIPDADRDTQIDESRMFGASGSFFGQQSRVLLSALLPKERAHAYCVCLLPVLDGFSFRKMWAFTGPGLLMCIAYMDPGNIEANLQAGVQAKYKLLWVLLGSTALGLLLQRLSLRLGVVTGQHLAEMCYLQYPRLPRLFLWLMIEIAIIGSDMQEVIGTAIALYLLSNRLIPLWLGVVLTMLDTFMFLLLDRYGLRKLELFFLGVVAIMILSFGYEFVVVTPDTGQLFEGFVFPWCTDCNRTVILQAIGIIGSTIMPHNLYLHSGLVKSRAVDRTKARKVQEANLYFFWECFVGLFLSLIVNAIITAVFAQGLYQKTNVEVRDVCLDSSVPFDNLFSNNTDIVELDIYSAGVYLGCQYGVVAMYVWGVGVLAAGEGTTMTGCYAGQLAMEGFLHLKWSKWKRVLFTRTFAILPTFIVAFYSSLSEMSNMNDFLNAVMSIQIPFATLPLVAFTSNSQLMGQFVNGVVSKIVTMMVSAVVIAINIYFVTSSWLVTALQDYRLLTCLILYFSLYFIMCLYLVLHTFANMVTEESALSKLFLQKTDQRMTKFGCWNCSKANKR